MSVAVNPPMTPVTAGSNGIAAATIPNVCKMPGPPAPFVPAPLPNIGRSSLSPKKYSKKVKVEGKKVAIKGATFKSQGDIASKATGGGIVSSQTHGVTKFVGPGSMDVKFEGKNVQLLSDPMLNNCGGGGVPANSATVVGVLQETGMIYVAGDEACPLCEEKHGPDGKLEESAESRGIVEDVIRAIDASVLDANPQIPDVVRRRKSSAAAIADLAQVVRNSTKAERAVFNKVISENQVAMSGHVGLTAMVGGVTCKCGKTFGGTSTVQYRDVTKRHSHHCPYPHHTLADPPDMNRFKTRRYSKFQKLVPRQHQEAFRDVWIRARAKTDQSLQQMTDVNFYPPGTCAAQILCAHALEHQCRPIGLTERYYSTKGSALFKGRGPTKLRVRDSVGGKPREATPAEVSGNSPIPPCGTCEIILQALLCFEDGDRLECKPKSARTVCYRCN